MNGAAPATERTHVPGINKLRKDELIHLLREWGEAVDDKLTREELITVANFRNPKKKESVMKGLPHMKKEELQQFAAKHGVPLGEHDTRGTVLLKIRTYLEIHSDCTWYDQVEFGKYTDLTYLELATSQEGYKKWAIETYLENRAASNPRLQRMAKFFIDKGDEMPNEVEMKEEDNVKSDTKSDAKQVCGLCAKTGHAATRCPTMKEIITGAITENTKALMNARKEETARLRSRGGSPTGVSLSSSAASTDRKRRVAVQEPVEEKMTETMIENMNNDEIAALEKMIADKQVANALKGGGSC